MLQGFFMCKKYILLASLFLVSCGHKDPLAHLSQENIDYLFGFDKERIEFMGIPEEGHELSCNSSQVRQGYVFEIKEGQPMLISIRPTSTEKHFITNIKAKGDSIKVYAKNLMNSPFTLTLSNTLPNQAFIDFGGEDKRRFLRCKK